MFKNIFGEKISGKNYKVVNVNVIYQSERMVEPGLCRLDPNISQSSAFQPDMINVYHNVTCAGELILEDPESNQKIHGFFIDTKRLPYVGFNPGPKDQETIKKLEDRAKEIKEKCQNLFGKLITVSGKLKKSSQDKDKKIIIIENIEEILKTV
jgi:hypothetical protein